MATSTRKTSTEVETFCQLLREGLPALVRDATAGRVWTTGDRVLPARSEQEAAFQVFLSSGASYRLWLQQVREGEQDGCQQCGQLVPVDQLSEAGTCPECADTGEHGPPGHLTGQALTDWLTAHRQHFPYEDKGPPSPAQLKYAGDVLAAHPFRPSRDGRHEYTLKHEWSDVGPEVFEDIVQLIREHGRTEVFGGFPWRMLDSNGYKFWTYFSSSVPEVEVLNRKPLPGNR